MVVTSSDSGFEHSEDFLLNSYSFQNFCLLANTIAIATTGLDNSVVSVLQHNVMRTVCISSRSS